MNYSILDRILIQKGGVREKLMDTHLLFNTTVSQIRIYFEGTPPTF